ncbi:MAG: hypothetical protein H6Q48_3563 [Deltaproteobacteria bacterium]|nr:hypothetical protein [Deltaproteobacteria bacterium]
MAVIAIRDMMYGSTTRMLWSKGRGPEKRSWEILSIGPMSTMERVVFLVGSMTAAVASV